VPSQHFIDKCLIPDTPSTGFLAKLIEDSGVDSNRNELARLVAKRRATDA
jgi:hypothetical protein